MAWYVESMFCPLMDAYVQLGFSHQPWGCVNSSNTKPARTAKLEKTSATAKKRS